jgi:transposase, IS30 family
MQRHINQSDRACIAALLRKKYSYSEVARVLGFHPSTIGREVGRNSTGTYGVHEAERLSRQRRAEARVQYRQIDTDANLKQVILVHLKLDWSPDQIVERCGMSSVSSIYRYLDRNTHLKCYLRRHGKRRRMVPNEYQAGIKLINARFTIDPWLKV